MPTRLLVRSTDADGRAKRPPNPRSVPTRPPIPWLPPPDPRRPLGLSANEASRPNKVNPAPWRGHGVVSALVKLAVVHDPPPLGGTQGREGRAPSSILGAGASPTQRAAGTVLSLVHEPHQGTASLTATGRVARHTGTSSTPSTPTALKYWRTRADKLVHDPLMPCEGSWEPCTVRKVCAHGVPRARGDWDEGDRPRRRETWS